ncbi:hypothetical protein NVP1249A_07 [Vibrio phage 1.249.A._10N.261.55.B9]|uniref:Coil containing protein n=2 Tax=Autolykiviridae TaxID=2184034 RepID=A0A2I7RXE9_9VIRU|nr:hypothetical protein KMD63_gp07 [Vibrio phage 1.249.A._10N.261.55.B9]AUR98301.1 hypothetical protein NVP1249A_07 [Vibrio phage 1.249.A._10N.261.55.B9]AUR98323.1 hypothetical protein NVP1249B_07 [Vibrio phage 1.249.B._10N.261.55.B9]
MSKSEIKKPESEQSESPIVEPKPSEAVQTETSSGGSLDNIANTLADSMPEVQEHAIEQEKAKTDAEREKWADLEDVDGNTFDPAIHKTNKDAEPTLSRTGKLIKKPGRKGGGGSSSGPSVIGVKQEAKPDPEQAARIQARASGKMAANLLMTLGIVAGGEEWQPIKDPTTGIDEKQMLESAFADYFEATGKTDIPPGMALTVAIGGYALPRFTMPKTRSRMQKVKDWVVRKIADRKLRKHGLKTEKTDEK